MPRFFNIAGPCKLEDPYTLPIGPRLPRNIKEQANYNNSCLQGKVANENISNIIAKSKGFFQKRRHLAMMKKSLPKISNN